MSLETTIVGSNLDAGGNLKVALTNSENYIGRVRIVSENDPGTVTGAPLLVSPETSQDYRLRTAIDTVMFTESFNATIQNTNNWYYTNATVSVTAPGSGTINFSQGTTAAHGAFMRTSQYFPYIDTAPLSVEFTVGFFTAQLAANELWLMGIGLPTAATTLPTDGVWLQASSTGWRLTLANNGTLTTSVADFWSSANNVLGQLDKWTLIIGYKTVDVWRNDILIVQVLIPTGSGQVFQAASAPVFMMKYNTGAVSSTNTMRVSDVTVLLTDIQTVKPWPHQMASAGLGGYVGQNGQTQGQTSNWTNNVVLASTQLLNTAGVAATLGGIVLINPVTAPALNTDGLLFSYQNPVPSVNITGRNLVITGVKVQGIVSAALTGGPVIYAYAVVFGHTAATLVTVETGSFVTATTHAPRRVYIGTEVFASGALQGAAGTGATLTLKSPIVVRPGEFVGVTARNMGVLPTVGTITAGVTFDAYWE